MADNNHAAAVAPHPDINDNVAVSGGGASGQANLPISGHVAHAVTMWNSGDGDGGGHPTPTDSNNTDLVDIPWTHSQSKFASSNAAKFYANNNHSLTTLIAMSIGMRVPQSGLPYYDASKDHGPPCQRGTSTQQTKSLVMRLFAVVIPTIGQ